MMLRAISAFLVATVVLGVGSAAAPAAEGQLPPGLPPIPGLPKTPRGTVSYLIHAGFGLTYEIEWTEASGDEFADCSTWRVDRGTNEVVAGSDPRPGRAEPMPGRLAIFPAIGTDDRTGGWGTGSALGSATADVHRTWRQRGGSNWTSACGGTAPAPFRPSPDDCLGGRARQYEARNASVVAEMRRGNVNLKLVTTPVRPSSDDANLGVLSITIVGRSGYQKCRTSRYAPELPGNIGLRLRKADFNALRRLKPGERHRIQQQWSGDCTADLPENAACRFTLDAHVDIRRWKPGTPYP